MKKKMSMLIAFALMMLAPLSLYAQSEPADYFVGNWNVLIEGTPDGDTNMEVTILREEGKLVGSIAGGGEESMKFTKIEEKADKSITAYFSSASGYDVYLFLEKKDINSMEGSLMDMFDASAKRIVDEE